jgi:hypothetical protein
MPDILRRVGIQAVQERVFEGCPLSTALDGVNESLASRLNDDGWHAYDARRIGAATSCGIIIKERTPFRVILYRLHY